MTTEEWIRKAKRDCSRWGRPTDETTFRDEVIGYLGKQCENLEREMERLAIEVLKANQSLSEIDALYGAEVSLIQGKESNANAG